MPPLPEKPDVTKLESNEEKREQPWKRFFSDPDSDSGGAGLEDQVVVGAPVSVDSKCPKCGNETCTCFQGTFMSA